MAWLEKTPVSVIFEEWKETLLCGNGCDEDLEATTHMEGSRDQQSSSVLDLAGYFAIDHSEITVLESRKRFEAMKMVHKTRTLMAPSKNPLFGETLHKYACLALSLHAIPRRQARRTQ
jgi:hypothetical protein